MKKDVSILRIILCAIASALIFFGLTLLNIPSKSGFDNPEIFRAILAAVPAILYALMFYPKKVMYGNDLPTSTYSVTARVLWGISGLVGAYLSALLF